MTFNLLTRPRMVLDQEIREPTLLALALPVIGVAIFLVGCAIGMAGLPAFGHMGLTCTAVAAIWALLVLSYWRIPTPGHAMQTARQRWFRRIVGWARGLSLGLLTCWLGLIAWLECGPGGPDPAVKADAALIRVVTWNIHCGQTAGPPWKQFDWPARKTALQTAIEQIQPDILCVQEATPEQVAFLEETLPGHYRAGVGRDDGGDRGEHCAIYFDLQRFEELEGSTFWLEEPIDQPRVGSALDIKRICTWVRLRDRLTGRACRLYNTHLYLTESPRLTAAKWILDHIAKGDPADAIVLTADFNAPPSVPSRQRFYDAGLVDSAERAGKALGLPTFHLYGIGLVCLDGILLGSQWRVEQHAILDVKPQNTYPSDHFAILADLALTE